ASHGWSQSLGPSEARVHRSLGTPKTAHWRQADADIGFGGVGGWARYRARLGLDTSTRLRRARGYRYWARLRRSVGWASRMADARPSLRGRARGPAGCLSSRSPGNLAHSAAAGHERECGVEHRGVEREQVATL